jgi:RNA polymerase sigma-70 factor (ECF subfamily)
MESVSTDAPDDAALALSEEELFDLELRPVILPAYRLALGMRLRPAEAEDAVQEAALRAWHHRRTRRSGTAFRPWFLAIVANRCRDTHRARWARVLHLETAPAMEEGSAAGDPEVIDLRRALRSLPAPTRLLLVLRFYLDLPYDEIGMVLGISANGAKLRMKRAIGKLQDALGVPAEA